MAKALREEFPQSTIDAVDKSDLYLKTSHDYYDQICCISLDEFQTEKQYDVIILLDVLEHLENPWQSLLRLKQNNLKESGVVVISIPNVAHWTIRAKLLAGKFRYQEAGIMDATHLRFFTLETYNDLIHSCGLNIMSMAHTTLVKYFNVYNNFPFALIPAGYKQPLIHQLASWYPTLFAVQFVSISKVASDPLPETVDDREKS